MKNITIAIVVMFYVSISQVQSLQNIQGSVWVCDFIENISDSLIFNTDSTYEQYSCGIGEYNSGVYEIKNDTLYLYQQFDDEINIRSTHRIGKSIQKYILSANNKLQIIYHKFENSVSDKFDESYQFERVIN